jgi:uncharacterized protein (DUF58 family)
MPTKLRLRPADVAQRMMWKNFLTSIGLLTIAMMAALYSSSAGRAGRVPAAGVSAISALVIAIWVGIRFVPRLAQSVDWNWWRFFSHYKITREGWIFLGAVTIVVFAAINTANNLLYMVLSALLAALVVSGILSELNLRYVYLEGRIPVSCFAGEPFTVSFLIRNEKRVTPAFSIQLEPMEGCAFRFVPFYTVAVLGNQHVAQSGDAMLPRRGRYAMDQIRAASRYPFGFFEKRSHHQLRAECICYPEIIPQERMDFSVLDIQGRNQRFERGLGFDLYRIRDYVPSDSARQVHWKASAKTALLKTREYAAEENRRAILAFDRFGRPDDAEQFEHLVSYAASLAYHLINDGVDVTFLSDDWQTDYGKSATVLDSILHYLALVTMSEEALPLPHATEGTVVLSLRQR